MDATQLNAAVTAGANMLAEVGRELGSLNQHVGQLHQHVGKLTQILGESDQRLRSLTESLNGNARAQDNLTRRLVMASWGLVFATLVLACVEYFKAHERPEANYAVPAMPPAPDKGQTLDLQNGTKQQSTRAPQ